MTKEEKIKYLLIPASGFGIGGGLWIGVLYVAFLKRLESAGLIIGLGLFILFSGVSLIIFEHIKIYKKIFLLFGIGLGYLIAFLILFLGFLVFGLGSFSSNYFSVLGFLLILLISIVIVSLGYAVLSKFLLDKKIWPIFLGSLIGHSFVFPASLIAYDKSIFNFFIPFLTFIILGLCIGWGMYKGQKVKLAETKQALQKT